MADKVKPDVARWEQEDWRGYMRLIDEEAFYRSTILRVIDEEIARLVTFNSFESFQVRTALYGIALLREIRARFEEAE